MIKDILVHSYALFYATVTLSQIAEEARADLPADTPDWVYK